jgi:hypothetical protein
MNNDEENNSCEFAKSINENTNEDLENDEESTPKLKKDKEQKKPPNCRRTKERKIGFIIKKVLKWRQLYNGVPDDRGSQIRCSLEESAQKVGISKKSLDDYLLQIR